MPARLPLRPFRRGANRTKLRRMGDEVSLYEDDVDVDGWVLQLQTELEAAGFSPGKLDGWFGPNTKAAVEAFQAANGLEGGGVVGNQTWSVLRGRDPEPPGVNNGPHGDTRPHAHGSGSSAPGAHGIGSSFPDADIVLTNGGFDGSYVYIDVDVQGTLTTELHVWAEVSGPANHTSEAIVVNSTGTQTIPLGVSVVEGVYGVTVHASAHMNTSTASHEFSVQL